MFLYASCKESTEKCNCYFALKKQGSFVVNVCQLYKPREVTSIIPNSSSWKLSSDRGILLAKDLLKNHIIYRGNEVNPLFYGSWILSIFINHNVFFCSLWKLESPHSWEMVFANLS